MLDHAANQSARKSERPCLPLSTHRERGPHVLQLTNELTTTTTAKMPGTRGPVPVPLETHNRNLTQDILDLLDTKDTLQTNEDFPAIPQAEIKAALDRLASRSMLEYKPLNTDKVVLTPESEDIVANGSHEFKVWKAVKEAGKVSIKELPVRPRDIWSLGCWLIEYRM